VPQNKYDNELLEAIRQHRNTIGTGYHYHSFRTVHEANMTLWKVLNKPAPTYIEPIEQADSGLARPAMMEDTE
jgi:hypothetical protein